MPRSLNVIEVINMSVIEIKNEKLSVGISTYGSELMHITTNTGKELLWNGDAKVWKKRAPLLFPICGGLKEDRFLHGGKSYTLGKHGFAQTLEFVAAHSDETSAEFWLESNEETKAAYPFDFKLRVIYQLEGNKLKVTNVVENKSDEPMYFSIGAHEGYSCPEGIQEYQIQFDEPQTLNSYVLNGNLLEDRFVNVLENRRVFPLKYDYFAVDALVFKNIGFNRATLAKKDGTKIASVEFDQAKYFLLWTKPGAKYICLEPWCGVQDIVGSSFELKEKEGIVSIESNQSFTFTHTIECFDVE